jgi:predicted kinase
MAARHRARALAQPLGAEHFTTDGADKLLAGAIARAPEQST